MWTKATWTADEETLEKRKEFAEKKPTVLTREQAKARENAVEEKLTKRVDNYEKSGIIYGEPVQGGVGAKSSSYPIVYYPGTDIQVDFVIGSRPQFPPDHTMAGKNCKTHRQIDDIDRLVDTYNCDASNWQKEKARYEVYDEYGEIRVVELHWYQHPDIGKVEYKVKTKGGYVYVDEWD